MFCEYDVRLLNGVLCINGMPAEDYLDNVTRCYTLATRKKIDAELIRLIRCAFEAGRDAEPVAPDEPVDVIHITPATSDSTP